MERMKVFSTRADAESYLTTLYAEGMPYGFCMSSSNTDRRLLSSSTLASACDEGEDVATWGDGQCCMECRQPYKIVTLHGMKIVAFI